MTIECSAVNGKSILSPQGLGNIKEKGGKKSRASTSVEIGVQADFSHDKAVALLSSW